MDLPKNHFVYPIMVKAEHIDVLNHVNNEVYLKWMLEAAIAHSRSIGFSLDTFKSHGGFFVVRRHEIDYLSSAYLDENLSLTTWISEISAARANREYILVREADQKVLLKGKTYWVYLDLKTGQPAVIPEPIKRAYQ